MDAITRFSSSELKARPRAVTKHAHSRASRIQPNTHIDTDTQIQTCTWCKGSALQAIRKQKRNSDLFLEFELTASITILKRGRKPECPEKTPDSMPCEKYRSLIPKSPKKVFAPAGARTLDPRIGDQRSKPLRHIPPHILGPIL